MAYRQDMGRQTRTTTSCGGGGEEARERGTVDDCRTSPLIYIKTPCKLEQKLVSFLSRAIVYLSRGDVVLSSTWPHGHLLIFRVCGAYFSSYSVSRQTG